MEQSLSELPPLSNPHKEALDAGVKDIPGYEGRYSISRDGRVWSWLGIKWLKGVVKGNNKPYEYVTLSIDNIPRSVKICVLVLETYIGPRPLGMFALHRDDTLRDHLDNLYWGTRQQNLEDSWINSRVKTKLGESDVREIRRRSELGESRASLGREYGVSANNIKEIAMYRTWIHVK